MLIHLLTFWKLSIVLFFHLKSNVSETELCLHPHEEPTQSGAIDRAPKEHLEHEQDILNLKSEARWLMKESSTHFPLMRTSLHAIHS
jgi:hypothetical protein